MNGKDANDRRRGSAQRPSGSSMARLPGAAGAGLAVVLGIAGLAGCRSQAEMPDGQPVELGAFAARPAPDAAAPPPPSVDPPAITGGSSTEGGVARRTPLGAGSVIPPRVIDPGTPSPPPVGAGAPAPSRRAVQAGDTFVVDALVGQINGRPIFASEFFEPLADELRAIGLGSDTQTAFAQAAAPRIRQELSRRVEDALYLAEAEAALTPEERQGLRYWLAEIRSVTVATRGGSRAEADRRLRATDNRTLEEEVQRQRNEGLQSKLIREKILPRIIVSKYEIEREYQRRFEEFNPPPRTRVDRLIVRPSEADLVASINERLAAGESIIDIASELSAAGRAQVSELGVFGVRPAELASSDLVAEVLRQYADGWEELGDWTGPIETSRVSWFYVGEVQQAPGRPSYDEEVQRILKSELRTRKFNEELFRFKARLRQDSIISQEQEMLETLVEIAVRRYGPR